MSLAILKSIDENLLLIYIGILATNRLTVNKKCLFHQRPCAINKFFDSTESVNVGWVIGGEHGTDVAFRE